MICELGVGAMGAGSLFMGWACMKRGWMPMAVLSVMTATFCASVFLATRGPVVGGALTALCLAVGVWVIARVRPDAPPAQRQSDQGAVLALQT